MKIHQTLLAIALLAGLSTLSACGQSTAPEATAIDDAAPVAEQAAPQETEPAPIGYAASSDEPIRVTGQLTVQDAAGNAELIPDPDTQSFDMDILLASAYGVSLVERTPVNAEGWRPSWKIKLSRSPVFGNETWFVELSKGHAAPLACGGMTLHKTGPRHFQCQGVDVTISPDRRELTLAFSETNLIADMGASFARFSGTLTVAFPAPLAIARMEDYPSRSAATIMIDGTPRELSLGQPRHGGADAKTDIDAILVSPVMADGFVIGPDSINLTRIHPNEVGASDSFKCGRPLTEAEHDCIDKVGLGPRCDTSFLTEAARCKSIQFSETDGVIKASVDENLIDDMRSRNPKTTHLSVTITSGPTARGNISSADNAVRFTCAENCHATRGVEVDSGDVIEMITISNDAQEAITIRRSMLYPNRASVILNMAYFGGTQADDNGAVIRANALRFDDKTGWVEFDGVQLENIMTQQTVVLSGRVQAFAR